MIIKNACMKLVIPKDIRAVLHADAQADAKWKSLTPLAQRDFVLWVQSAKLPETRERRVASIPSRLASGKRRPCCFSVVPMGLYSALNKNKKAKGVWSSLTPDERRDFSVWVDGAKGPGEKLERIDKVCAVLSAGKRRV